MSLPLRALTIAVVLTIVWQGHTPALSQPAGPDRLIVVFKDATVPPNASEVVQRAGGTVADVIPQIGVVVAEAIGLDKDTLAARLRGDPTILAVGPDKLITEVRPVAEFADGVVAEGQFPHPLPTFPSGLPADFLYTSTPQQWAVKRVGAQGGGVSGGTGPGAWDVTFGTRPDGVRVKIAILDTGVSPDHPDLAPNLVFNASLATSPLSVPPAPICDDGSPVDQSGHGTWTASLAAGAKGTSTGLIIGVAPEAQILNIKVLRREPAASLPAGVADTPFNRCLFGAGTGQTSWILAGIALAVEQGADVINMSFGEIVDRTGRSVDLGDAAVWSAYVRAINHAVAAGVVVVASGSERGNGGIDVNNFGPFVHVPSDAPHAIAVVATTNPAVPPPTPPPRQPCAEGADCLAFYSNFGSRLRALAAPGGDLPPGGCGGNPFQCAPTGAIRAACSPGIFGRPVGLPPAGSFGCFSLAGASQSAWYVQTIGTSASAAIVAGVAALVKAANPSLSPNQIRTILQQTADDIGKVGYDSLFNFGLVNACRAVAAAANRFIDCP